MKQNPDSIWAIVRSILIWFMGFFITALVLITIMLLAILRKPNWIHNVAFLWGKSITFCCGTKIEVEGLEKIYRDGPAIYAFNHQSLFDILIIYNFLDVQFRWMAKAQLFKIPVFGLGMRAADYIPVERGDKKLAMKSLFEAADQVRKGKSIIIFPEGTRGHEDGTMLPFKKGGFILAKKAQVTLQPITLWGANRIVPVDRKRRIQRIFPGTVRVVIHDPIPADQVASLTSDQLSDRIRSAIEAPMDRLRAFSQELDQK